MISSVIPKLPMRNKIETKNFYINQLGFKEIGHYDYYLMLEKDNFEIHFLNLRI